MHTPMKLLVTLLLCPTLAGAQTAPAPLGSTSSESNRRRRDPGGTRPPGFLFLYPRARMPKQTSSTWLNKKGLTVQQFCDKVGVEYGEAEGWFRLGTKMTPMAL